MKFQISNNSNFLDYFVINIISIYIFLWSQSLFEFEERLLLILLIPIYFFLKPETLDKRSIKYFSILILLITLHLIINNILLNNIFYQNFEKIAGCLIIAIITIMYKSFIIRNLTTIIYLFTFILFLFFLYENFFLKNLYSLKNFDCLNGWFSNSVKLKLFSENSHFGMIAPAIISYFIFLRNTNNYLSILNISIISFMFLFLSTTLLVGTIFCLSFFLLIRFKSIQNIQKIIAISFLILSIFIIFFKPQCNMRFTETITGLFINSFTSLKKDSSIRKEWIETLPHQTLNISSEVTLNSYNVSLKTIQNYPLGIGLNNYAQAYEQFSKNLSPDIQNLNKQDGSNNFSKLIAEFGIFSLLLFYFIFSFILKDKKNFDANIFFYSIVITQLIRGAGFFNGGFLLCLFIILSLIFNQKKNVSN